jgi:hypothetical protein
VSLGTGTSIFRVEAPGHAVRVGGTALGGGTLAGLASLLSGPSTHAERAALAARGDRSRVDLFVRDLYPHDDLPLAKDLTAANFGKALSREPADLALALAHLVGENVGLLAGSLARDLDAPRAIVYAGSTLEGHDALANAVSARPTPRARPRAPPRRAHRGRGSRLLRSKLASMTSPKHFDLVILGCGPAGERAAILAARSGKRVAVVERAPEVGGNRINWGTIPSKTLRESALFVNALTRNRLHGIRARSPTRSPSRTSCTASVSCGKLDLINASLDKFASRSCARTAACGHARAGSAGQPEERVTADVVSSRRARG